MATVNGVMCGRTVDAAYFLFDCCFNSAREEWGWEWGTSVHVCLLLVRSIVSPNACQLGVVLVSREEICLTQECCTDTSPPMVLTMFSGR